MFSKYSFKASNLKQFRKSIKGMFENVELVLKTIKEFEPK